VYTPHLVVRLLRETNIYRLIAQRNQHLSFLSSKKKNIYLSEFCGALHWEASFVLHRRN
jgi:hypothetical protein